MKIEEILNKIGLELISELKAQLVANNSIASGNLLKNLSYTVTKNSDSTYLLEINTPAYAKFVNAGRSPGKFPPPPAIQQWILDKNLNVTNIKSAAFLIGRKISEDGITATNFIDNAYKIVIQRNIHLLQEAVAQDILDQAIKNLKTK